MTIRLGAHVEQRDPVAEAVAIGANAAQFFLGDPQSWKKPALSYADGPDALIEAAAKADVALYVHSPYVINVASTNNRIRIPSRKLLQQTLDGAAEIQAAGVIVHGGHVGADDDPAVGIDNWRKAIEGLKIEVPLLIENTAGGANAMVRKLERLEQLWAVISQLDNAPMVGFTLDTCHAHAGGNDLDSIVADVMAITGRIDLIHANDSRDAFDSGADRHATFGKGKIDLDKIVHVIQEAECPVVLETPYTHIGEDVAWLKRRLG